MMSTLKLVLVLLLLIGVLSATGGIAAADNPGKSGPGENDNRGLANANENGVNKSERGIATAFYAIGCMGETTG